MDVENLIISKIIETQSLREATQTGVKAFHFTKVYAPVYQWILDYATQHNAVPTERALSKAHGHITLEDATDETFSGLFSELMDAYRSRVLAEAMTDATASLNKEDTRKALESLSKAVQSASAESTRLRDYNIIEGWEDRIARYEEMRQEPNALRGIPSGFYGLDRITHGFRPQQWVVMVGEQKRGKSLFQLIMAKACHRSGRRPMFISYEMSVEEQLARYDALLAKVPYDKILSGQLSDAEMDRLYRELRDDKNMMPFFMSEDTTGATTPSALAAKIQEYRPDALYVDGIYLMQDDHGEPKGTPQALTNISRDMKKLAQSFDIPIIGTSQVLSWKLQNKKSRAITADAIGYTSAFAQDADLVLGVERHPDIDDQAIIRVVEARTAPRAEVHVQWNFQTMEFQEVDEYGDIDPSYL
jgi:replicative DNA helicase